jgi:energy-coupling factor transporter ATP-binding protein EcfA2
MGTSIFRVYKPAEYRKAGPDDLIELKPVPRQNPLFLPKWFLEVFAYAIANHEIIHVSGSTGSGKSSLIEALHLAPENFQAICAGLGFRPLPIKLYPIEMATFEAPGELYHRRSLKEGTTFDEPSRLVQALEDASQANGSFYPLVWLREMGRVHSSSVQGDLLNLMSKYDILLPDGRRLNCSKIAWVADSNYQAEGDSTHTLVTLDDALKRRFTISLTLDYLDPLQEIQVLNHITNGGA